MPRRSYQGHTIEVETLQSGNLWSVRARVYDAAATLVKEFDALEQFTFSSEAAAERVGYDLAREWIDRRGDRPPPG